MPNILVIGTGPLFAPDVKVFNGQALRTWHLASPLREAGHHVDLVVLPAEGSATETGDSEALVSYRYQTFKYQMVNVTDPAQILQVLQDVHDQGQYDAIVAVNVNAAYLVCQLASNLPIWADLNGYMMGEAQTKSRVYSTDQYLKHFWDREKLVLRRADRISSVSYKQMLAVLGELGAVGRLNQYTFDYQFVSVIANAVYEGFLDRSMYPAEPRFRGTLFPANAFAVLWSGGFNTWTDTKTLAAAISLAMEQDPRIHFVATGAAIPGHDEVTYDTFRSEMEKTGFLDRCHLLGWVEAKDLFPLYKECDIGINVDSLNYETLFGARNRLTNMMGAGLTVLTTLGTEVSEIIREEKLGYTVPIGAVEKFTDAILHIARSPHECRLYAKRAAAFCKQHFSYKSTTTGLVKWAAEPTRAPDNAEKVLRKPQDPNPANMPLNPIEEEMIKLQQHDLDKLIQSCADLDNIRQKPAYKLYKSLFT